MGLDGSTKSIQRSSSANEPCLNYRTAAVIMRVRRAAHAVASTAEARFHVSKEAPYTSSASFFLAQPMPGARVRPAGKSEGKFTLQHCSKLATDVCFYSMRVGDHYKK